MPIQAVQHIRRMRGGAQSHLMRCADGHYYVVKFQNNPQHARVLVNDWLGTRLAELIGLPVPVVDIVDVNRWLIEHTPDLRIELCGRKIVVTPGPSFGSRYVVSLDDGQVHDYLPESMIGRVRNLNHFAGMLAFDKWTCNADGRQAAFWKGKQNLTPAGLLMEGHYISNPETGRLLVIWGCYANNTMVPSGRKLTICTKGGTAEYPTSFFESTRGRYATVSTRRNLLFPHTGVTLHQCRSGEPRMESSYSGIVSIYPRPLSPGFVPESATAAASTVFAKVTRLCNFSR